MFKAIFLSVCGALVLTLVPLALFLGLNNTVSFISYNASLLITGAFITLVVVILVLKFDPSWSEDSELEKAARMAYDVLVKFDFDYPEEKDAIDATEALAVALDINNKEED